MSGIIHNYDAKVLDLSEIDIPIIGSDMVLDIDGVLGDSPTMADKYDVIHSVYGDFESAIAVIQSPGYINIGSRLVYIFGSPVIAQLSDTIGTEFAPTILSPIFVIDNSMVEINPGGEEGEILYDYESILLTTESGVRYLDVTNSVSDTLRNTMEYASHPTYFSSSNQFIIYDSMPFIKFSAGDAPWLSSFSQYLIATDGASIEYYPRYTLSDDSVELYIASSSGEAVNIESLEIDILYKHITFKLFDGGLGLFSDPYFATTEYSVCFESDGSISRGTTDAIKAGAISFSYADPFTKSITLTGSNATYVNNSSTMSISTVINGHTVNDSNTSINPTPVFKEIYDGSNILNGILEHIKLDTVLITGTIPTLEELDVLYPGHTVIDLLCFVTTSFDWRIVMNNVFVDASNDFVINNNVLYPGSSVRSTLNYEFEIGEAIPDDMTLTGLVIMVSNAARGIIKE